MTDVRAMARKRCPYSVFMYAAATEPPMDNRANAPNTIPGSRISAKRSTSPTISSVMARVTSEKISPKGLNCNDYIRHKLLTLGQARSGGVLAERVERGGDSVEFRLAKRPLGGTYRLGNLALASRTDDGRGDLGAS